MRIEKSFVENAHTAAGLKFNREQYADHYVTVLRHATAKPTRKPAGSNGDRYNGDLHSQAYRPGPGVHEPVEFIRGNAVYVGILGAHNYAGHVAADLANAGLIV